MPGVRRSRSAIVTLALLVLPIACSDSTGPEDPPGPGPGRGGGGSGPVASVVIEPGAVLLTAAGETMQLEAKVYDAAGKPVQAEVTWHSNAPGTIGVSGGGLATATAGLGSAQITAVAQGISSEPALALVARPATGVVLIPDSLIVTDPVAVDPDADYGPGWRYRIRVTGNAPEAGRLVIGTGGRSVAGRVVGATVQGAETELTVELVALNQLFADLKIDETIPLVEMEAGSGGASWRAPEPGWGPAGFEAADTEFKLGRFECTASGEVPELDLPNPKLDIDPDLSLALGYANGLEKYAVVGSITADFGYKPVFKATFEGKVGCETVLTTVTVPLGGVLAWFVGIQVPLGVGFELDGKLEIAEVGFDVTAHAEATAELGLLCPAAGGSCTGLTSFDAERDFGFELIAPNLAEQFKLELGAKGFVFARPSVGSKFSAKTQFAFLEATAGLKQSVDLATATRQVKETDYASGFKLEGQIDIGPGKDLKSAIEKLGDLLGTDLDIALALVDIDKTLAESPKGAFTITPASVDPGNDEALGDMATFTIDLDPVTYLGIESVEKVEIFWKKDDGNGGFSLDPGRPGCTDISGSSGQTKFECQADFLEEHEGKQTFYAFVHAKMFGIPIPIPLEVDDDGVANLAVGGVEVGGAAGFVGTSFRLNTNASVGRNSDLDSDVYRDDQSDLLEYEGSASSSAQIAGLNASGEAEGSFKVFIDEASGRFTGYAGSFSLSSEAQVDSTGGLVTGSGAEFGVTFDIEETEMEFEITGQLNGDPVHPGGEYGEHYRYRTLLLRLDPRDNRPIEEIFDHDSFGLRQNTLEVDETGTLPPGRYAFVFNSGGGWQRGPACEKCSVSATSSGGLTLRLRNPDP